MNEWKALPSIRAQRVTLRELRDTDVASLFAIFSDPEVMRYWSSVPLTDVEEARQMVVDIRCDFETKKFFKWGVARNEDDHVIGTCTLFNVFLENYRAEIGYALGREFWGNGFMTEALKSLIEYSFQNLNLHRLEADVDPRNDASIKTLERLGFRREGHLRERWHVGGEIQDALFYGLLRREWESNSKTS